MSVNFDDPAVVVDAEFGALLIDPDLPRPAFRPPRTFEDLTTAEQSLLRPPVWLRPCRYEHEVAR